jgi:hypothetical protein
MDRQDGLTDAGDAGSAAAEFPQKTPPLEDGHRLFSESPNARMRNVDGLLTC